MQQTSKLQRHSSKTLIDPIRGEMVSALQITMEEGAFNFHKI